MINAKTKIEKRNIQNKLRLLRKGQGVTQEELAERIGCSRQALNKFERGKTWSAEWEERYNIALGIKRSDPGGASPDPGDTQGDEGFNTNSGDGQEDNRGSEENVGGSAEDESGGDKQ